MTVRVALLLFAVVCAFAAPALADSSEPETPATTEKAQTPERPSTAAAPQEPKENPVEPEGHGTRLHWGDIPKNLLHDEAKIFTSPARINRGNVKSWIILGGATAALIATDQKFSDNLPQETRLSNASKWTSRLGSDYVIYPAWATFYFVGKLGDNPRARDTGRLGIEALLDADITVGLIKAATQRRRPINQGDSVAFFKGGDAFPSGHSIKAWALARIAALEFKESRIVPIVAYSLAAAVGVARVGGRRHNPSDVFVGSAMGFFIGDFVYKHHHAPSEKLNALRWLAEHVTFSFK
jgi:membrane-associated phospholipid phosphatase